MSSDQGPTIEQDLEEGVAVKEESPFDGLWMDPPAYWVEKNSGEEISLAALTHNATSKHALKQLARITFEEAVLRLHPHLREQLPRRIRARPSFKYSVGKSVKTGEIVVLWHFSVKKNAKFRVTEP